MVLIRTHFVLLLLVFAFVCNSVQTKLSQRIVNGQDVAVGEMPWVVSVRKDSVHVCVGNIISNHQILTAGSCLSDRGATAVNATRVTARVGSVNLYAGGVLVKVKEIHIHHLYGNFLHNIALITLIEPLNFNDKINKIALQVNNEEIIDDSEVVVSGWGVQNSNTPSYKLQKANMNVLSAPECEQQAGFGYESVICLKHLIGQGICHGDEGAGVVADKKLIGIASFAFGNCATKYPDVSSSVPYYNDWINATIMH